MRYGITRIAKVQELVFPQWSVATEVTVFEPTGNKAPEAGRVDTTGAGSQSSVAVGLA
jgi:hypothetical protein